MKRILYLLLLLPGHIFAQVTDSIRIDFSTYIHRVGKSNFSYLAEQFNVQIADAEAVSERVFPDPELTFESSKDDLNVELGYTLELGKRRARIRMARSVAELERLSLDYYFQELRAEATDVYLEAMLQKELLNVKRTSYNYMYELSVSDSIRYQLGEIEEMEARQSRMEANSLLNEYYEQEGAYQSALVELNRYMGRGADTLFVPVGNWHAFEKEYRLGELVDYSLVNRVDLVAAVKASEVALHELKLVKAERRMDIGLMVGYEKEWRGILPKHDVVKGGVTIPLKFSNTNRGAVRAAKYNIQKSQVELQETELMVQAEVSQAWFAYEAAKKQVVQYREGLLDDSQKLLEGILYKYQRGETNILEVLIAQRTYNEIQEQYFETLKSFSYALVELQKRCGMWDISF